MSHYKFSCYCFNSYFQKSAFHFSWLKNLIHALTYECFLSHNGKQTFSLFHILGDFTLKRIWSILMDWGSYVWHFYYYKWNKLDFLILFHVLGINNFSYKQIVINFVSISSNFLMYFNWFIWNPLILIKIATFFFSWYLWLLQSVLHNFYYWLFRVKQIKSAFYSLSKVLFFCFVDYCYVSYQVSCIWGLYFKLNGHIQFCERFLIISDIFPKRKTMIKNYEIEYQYCYFALDSPLVAKLGASCLLCDHVY